MDSEEETAISRFSHWSALITALALGASAFVVQAIANSSIHRGYIVGILVGAIATLLLSYYEQNRMLDQIQEDVNQAIQRAGDTGFRVGMLAVYENKVPPQIIEAMTEGIELGDAELGDPEAAAQAGIDLEDIDLEEMDDEDAPDRMFQ